MSEELNVLINNAGISNAAAFDSFPDSNWSVMTTNVQRVFTLIQQLTPLLEKGHQSRGIGRVINVGSWSEAALTQDRDRVRHQHHQR